MSRTKFQQKNRSGRAASGANRSDASPQSVVVKEPATADAELDARLNQTGRLAAIRNYVLVGATGYLLLTLIEQVDLNWRLTPVFASPSDRFVLLAYASLNILVGTILGLIVGVGSLPYAALVRGGEKALGRFSRRHWLNTSLAVLFATCLTAVVLNQFSHINSFIIGLIRELEKLKPLRESLLTYEQATSYLILMAIITACAVLGIIGYAWAKLNRYLRWAWAAVLTATILLVYYIDSRVQVQLYEWTLHRALYVVTVVLAMGLAAVLCGPAAPLGLWWAQQPATWRRAIFAGATVALAAAVVFTFLHFGANQGLKTQIFYRSTQAKQNFKLAWWVLDRDRDGYSAWLDGGDTNDKNASVNPGAPETVGDQLDNNGLAGDLRQQDLDDWHNQHNLWRPPPAAGQRFNIIYFFIDTVRADHLSTYGYQRKTTPNLDRLAERSVVFENGFSPAARTCEAIPRFMQSSYWDARIESWPEVLARYDYQVMLFPGRRSWERYSRMMPVARGAQGKPLKENINFIIETLGQTTAAQPFCAYIYIPDPHRPYVPHAEFDYGSSASDLYDGELAYTDFHIGRLFDWLEQSGHFQDTMIVVMSDHGESLGERDVYRHASQLYNEQTRVPMIVYCPGIGPRRIRDYVSTIDLGATLLSVNGLASPKDYLGVNLLPLMRGEPFDRPPVYAEFTGEEVSPLFQLNQLVNLRLNQLVHPETKKYMVVAPDGFKMIFNRDVYSYELYDLQNDPQEEHNLFNAMPEKAAELKRLVLQYVDIVTASRPAYADEGRFSKVTGADGDRVED